MTDLSDGPATSIPGVDLVVTAEEIRAAGLDALLLRAESLSWWDQRKVFFEAAQQSEEHRSALTLAANLTNFSFKPDDRVEPFRPMAIFDGKRSLVPQDFSDDQINALAAVGPEFENPSFRALVCDVVWLRNRRQAPAGFAAVDAYCDCIAAVIAGEAAFAFDGTSPCDVYAVEFLERACTVANALGWTRPEFDRLKTLITDIREIAFKGEDAQGFRRVSELDLNRGVTEPKAVAAQAEALASKQDFDAMTRQDLWKIAGRAHHHGRNDAAKNAALINAAECSVEKADAAPSSMLRSAFLHDAIEALRPIPGTRQRREDLHARLRDAQPGIRDEMSSHSHETDITELAKEAEARTKELTLGDALLALFVVNGRPPSPADIRSQVEEISRDAPLSTMMPVAVHDHQGRLVFQAPSLEDGGDADERMKFEVSKHRGFARELVVKARIDPIRRTIADLHFLDLDFLVRIFSESPFVPSGHAHFFASAALRFIAGDDASAFLTLCPQLENSLRHLLLIQGTDTTKINGDGTQEEAGLSKLLSTYVEEIRSFLPETYVEEIEMLFDYRGGPSIRNEAAHGKITYFGLFDSDIVYGSWLIMHLALLPLTPRWSETVK